MNKKVIPLFQARQESQESPRLFHDSFPFRGGIKESGKGKREEQQHRQPTMAGYAGAISRFLAMHRKTVDATEGIDKTAAEFHAFQTWMQDKASRDRS